MANDEVNEVDAGLNDEVSTDEHGGNGPADGESSPAGDESSPASSERDENPAAGTDDDDSFPREYVEELRRESAGYRKRAARADDLAHRLHRALVALDGRLADPDDLPYDEAHLDDTDALGAAIGALVDRKPGLKARGVSGDVGAGTRGTGANGGDLISIIKNL